MIRYCGARRPITVQVARFESSAACIAIHQLTAEIMSTLVERPGLKVVNLADGAPDNWTYLSETLPFGDECLDFDHARDHLSDAWSSADGEGTTAYYKRFETLRGVLREAAKGAAKVIDAVCRLRRRYPRRQALHKAVAYFREHRHRLPYARLRAPHLPIGSGVCKPLAKRWQLSD